MPKRKSTFKIIFVKSNCTLEKKSLTCWQKHCDLRLLLQNARRLTRRAPLCRWCWQHTICRCPGLARFEPMQANAAWRPTQETQTWSKNTKSNKRCSDKTCSNRWWATLTENCRGSVRHTRTQSEANDCCRCGERVTEHDQHDLWEKTLFIERKALQNQTFFLLCRGGFANKQFRDSKKLNNLQNDRTNILTK